MDGWYNAIREPELSLDVGRHRPGRGAVLRRDGCSRARPRSATSISSPRRSPRRSARRAFAPSSPTASCSSATRSAARRSCAKRHAPSSSSSARPMAGSIPWFGPHAPYVDNSEALLQRRGRGRARSTASASTSTWPPVPRTTRRRSARYGLTATQALERDGFFDGRVHAAHCLDLSDEDIAIFAAAPAASVAYCASAGLRSGREGICPAVKLREAGVTVALGTDNVAANNSYDMVSEMRVAGLVASHREGRAQPISSTRPASHGDHRGRQGARPRPRDRQPRGRQGGRHHRRRPDAARAIRRRPIPRRCWSIPAAAATCGTSGSPASSSCATGTLRAPRLRDIRSDYSEAYNDFWDRVVECQANRRRRTSQ